jgi:hypothetical protein
MVVRLREKGTPILTISRQLELFPSTIRRIHTRYQRYGSVTDRRRSGRPSILSDVDRRHIIIQGKRLPFHTASEVWQSIQPSPSASSPSVRTVSRVLLTSGLRSYKAQRKPRLTVVHRRMRLQFARKHADFDWTRVVFSDEKRFALRPDGPRRVRCAPGERQLSKFTTSTVKHQGGSIMVWVAMRYDGRLYMRWCGNRLNGVD